MLIIVSASLSGRLHWKPEKKSSHVAASFCMDAVKKSGALQAARDLEISLSVISVPR